jgi:hypothetical protein
MNYEAYSSEKRKLAAQRIKVRKYKVLKHMHIISRRAIQLSESQITVKHVELSLSTADYYIF